MAKEFDKRYNDERENSDFVEGRNSVIEALKSDREINKIMVAKGTVGSVISIIGKAKEKSIAVQEVDRAKLDYISDTGNHQGVIAYVSPKEYVEVEDILEIAKEKGEDPFIVILDGVEDGHNLGSIIRTADITGVHGVIIPKRRAVGLNSVVSKASAGAIEYVPVARVTNIANVIDKLKDNGVWVAGTDADGEESFFDADLSGGIALVIGGEGKGMSRLIHDKCDYVLSIPMGGNVNSLNASVAGAIVMYDIYRNRNKR